MHFLQSFDSTAFSFSLFLLDKLKQLHGRVRTFRSPTQQLTLFTLTESR